MSLSQEAFDRLLKWLSVDREQAGEKYEEIRHKLIKIFVCRGCSSPEDLADKTINRVVSKIEEVAGDYVGDPARYFSSVARLIYLEHLREKPLPPPPPAPDLITGNEPEYLCLEDCLTKLTPDNRKMILEYYQDEKQNKIANRKRLAEEMNIELNALRIRATRIRVVLEKCISDCLQTKSG